MTTQKLLAFTLSALCLSVLAFAQDDKPSTEGEMPPMGPPIELKQFDHLIGTWTADFKMREGPEAEWTTSPATIVYEKAMEDACIRGNFSSTFMGMPFNGQATMSYHRGKAKWQMTWIDNMGASQSMLEGDFKDGVMTLEGRDMHEGKVFHMRDITTNKSETQLDWEMHMSHDGGKTWYTGMKASYKKQS